MITWNNLDTLESFKELSKVGRVDIKEAMSGDNGAKRVKEYNIPMAEGFTYNFAAKQVDADVLEALAKLAKEAQLTEKFEALYNGAVINTGENRLVLHQLTRGQLGDAVVADGVDKRKFYVEQQERIAEFANKVHSGEITNAAGEKFTTVVQIGIGGSDLGPRAMYLALENWAKKNGSFKMEAKFISNVDPDDAASVLASVDVAHSIFILVSKSGTTLETLTNESFVKDALKNAGLDASKHMIAVTSETSPLAKSDDYLAAFFMDDYIGGRYSSTSAVGGAVLSLAFGPEVFAQFLDGAAAEDKLSKNADIMENPEMLDALIGVYERNVLGYPSTAVLPYSQALSRFPAHLQQADMESNGKSVNRFVPGRRVFAHGEIFLGKFVLHPRTEIRRRHGRFGKDHHAADLPVEPVDGIDRARREEVRHRALAGGILCREHARGLVADEHLRVLVKDGHIRASSFARIRSHCSSTLPTSCFVKRPLRTTRLPRTKTEST